MAAAHGQMVFYSAGRHSKDGGDLLDAAVFKVEEDDCRPFSLADSLKRLLELLILEAVVG